MDFPKPPWLKQSNTANEIAVARQMLFQESKRSAVEMLAGWKQRIAERLQPRNMTAGIGCGETKPLVVEIVFDRTQDVRVRGHSGFLRRKLHAELSESTVAAIINGMAGRNRRILADHFAQEFSGMIAQVAKHVVFFLEDATNATPSECTPHAAGENRTDIVAELGEELTTIYRRIVEGKLPS